MRIIEDASDPLELALRLDRDAHVSLLLDYDGTLVPYAATPSRAVPDADLLDLLVALADRPKTRVEIVSGRDAASLGHWFGDLPVTLRAEHGAFTREPGGGALWTAVVPVRARALASATDQLRGVVRRLGGFIEYKQSSASWHYRDAGVSVDGVKATAAGLKEALQPIGFDVVVGTGVVHVRPDGARKGRAVIEAFRREPRSMVIAIGDDATDEDMFRALPDGREGIFVGDATHATSASYRLAGEVDVRRLLSALVRRPSAMRSPDR